ncbi:ABC transporter ATP-binding protein SaoA [Clostridium hydrogeniformans]|uniref:ABC transporter ATP-binding protein SaoA n=1 Tax=Clostridium hydrogeniformans TaxID=349933 RepID=UPI000483C35E|nr:ABC transporter ATP-binding protein SaoA [Clostridium hydrogeniformans]
MKVVIENIDKVFKNNNNIKEVLKDISFNVNEGQFVSLLGPSGCGKTTLLSIIAGFQDATEGKILVNGLEVKKPGPDRGFIFQNYALFPWMTVKDNILYPMKQQKISKEKRKERLSELLKMAHLEGNEHLYPHQISGGMKQRTAVIRALACKPEVLLMDEPLGAVDFQMRQILQEELEALWLQDKTTVIMVTHDVDEAVYMSDRVIVMSTESGKIIGDLEINLKRPRNREDLEYESYKAKLTSILKDALNYDKKDKEIERKGINKGEQIV